MMPLWTLLVGSALALSPEAREGLRIDDCQPVLADRTGPATDGERLGLGRCLVIDDQGDKALQVLEPVTGELSAYADLLEGEALLSLGRFEEASKRLEGLSFPPMASRRALALQGRALVEKGDYSGAKAVLAPLLAGDFASPGFIAGPGDIDPGEVRWWLAEGAVRRGDNDAAIPVWRRIWVANPTSPRAEDARLRLLEQGKPVPNPASDEGQRLIAERIDTLEKLRMYGEALELRDLLPAKPAVPMGTGEQAQAAFDAKDYPRARELFAKLSNPTANQRFNHALAATRSGDYAGAAEIYRALYTAFPTHALGDQASFKVGYLAYDANELDRAVPLFREHLGRYPSSRHADEARWFIGWSLYRLGRLDDADATLSELLSKHGGSDLAAAARYWQGRIAGRQGDGEKARLIYQEVLRRWPVSGYAWWASRQLGDLPRGSTEPPAPAVPASLETPAWIRGQALLEAGLGAYARAELEPLAPQARSAGREARVALSQALAESGSFTLSKALVQDLCPGPGSGDPLLRRLCWPRPGGDIPARLAREGGLPSNLPSAIMTAESGLKPEVTSPAGARGIMQLMPKLAGDLYARTYPGRSWSADLLYEPGINARLGTAELVGLQASFGSRGVQPALPLVIAGYNGGAAAVERWLKAQGPDVEADVFAENIGYTETRQYVRRVLGYLRTYELVYGAD